MTSLATVVLLIITIHASFTEAAPSHSCDKYVAENKGVGCTCTPSSCSSGPPSVFWLNREPLSHILVIHNVTRQDGGTNYTCQQNCGGSISEVTYTLHVAYGPLVDKMLITGNETFITNGSRTLNLTCLATEVNPSPAGYNWTDTICSKHSDNDICSFEPQPGNDGISVVCRATNRITYAFAEERVNITFLYMPPAAPQIQGPGQTLTAGDTLSCTVTGGKPLVQSVNFSCDNPHHPDQNDAVNGSTSVTSYININTSQANENNMTCKCSAHWAPEPSYYTTSVSASFQTAYPPRGGPNIYISPTNQILKTGDNVFCEVAGGKPPVENITFYCKNQGHGNKEMIQNKTATSNLTINTSQATDDNMTCHCSAHWAMAPGHYTKNASASFRTEYPAKIQTFTLNSITNNVTVTASEKTNVTLRCEANGLPSPTVTLQGPQGHDITGSFINTTDTDSRTEHTIVAVNDTHMGNYTCKVFNGVRNFTVISIVTLNVNFPPRLVSSDGPGHSRDTADNMTKEGIDIQLRAYPTPDSFKFTGCLDKNSHDGVDVFSDSGMFTTNALQMAHGSPEVTCHIRPGHNVLTGCLYMVTISNGLGSAKFYFIVTGVPTLSSTDVDVLPIIIGVLVVVVVIIIIVIIVYCCKKKRKDKKKKQDALYGKERCEQARSNPTFNRDDHDDDSGIGERESPPLVMSPSTPDSKHPQHHLEAGYVDVGEDRDGVMRKKSARVGKAYEVTSLVEGGGARIAGETTIPPRTNSEVGYTEPWKDYPIDMPDGQPSVNKPTADTTTAPAGNNASPDHYQGPRGEEYASVGALGKGGSHSYTNVDSKQKGKPSYSNVRDDRPSEVTGYSTVALASNNKGNKAPGKGKQSGAVSMDARGSDTYDHFVGQGHDLTQLADPTYNHIGKF